jgi:hypothetical protein
LLGQQQKVGRKKELIPDARYAALKSKVNETVAQRGSRKSTIR